MFQYIFSAVIYSTTSQWLDPTLHNKCSKNLLETYVQIRIADQAIIYAIPEHIEPVIYSYLLFYFESQNIVNRYFACYLISSSGIY